MPTRNLILSSPNAPASLRFSHGYALQTGPDGIITHVTDSFTSILGISSLSVLGRHLSDFLSPGQKHKLAQVSDIADSGILFSLLHLPHKIFLSDNITVGQVRYCKWNIVYHHPGPIGLKKLLQDLFEEISYPVIVIKPDSGIIVFLNTSALKTLGYLTAELTGTSIYSIIHTNGNHPAAIGSVKREKDSLIKKDGSVIPLSISKTSISLFGEIHQAWHIAQNIFTTDNYSPFPVASRLTSILNNITDGFVAVDRDLNVLLWNRIIEQTTSIPSEKAIGRNIADVLPELLLEPVYDQYVQALREGERFMREHYYAPLGVWFETSAYPSSEGLFIYFRDITDRKNQEQILSLEKEVFEMNAQPDAGLIKTIEYFLLHLEKIFPGIHCSVVALMEDGQSIHSLSAPSLPPQWSEWINVQQVGPSAGSFGAAIFHKEIVICEDIGSDPLWDDFREIALQFQLRSCWSFPVLNTQKEVVATIAAYYKIPKKPGTHEYAILDRSSKMLGIIIENKQAEDRIKSSNERYLLATRATNDALYDYDMSSKLNYWGEGFYTLFGYQPSKAVNTLDFWIKNIHPDDRQWVLESVERHIRERDSRVMEFEYRFRNAAGESVLVNDRGFLIFNQEGIPYRIVGSIQDITEKRLMEKRLMKQELDKQKLIAKAVVDAQEKERADIGKELHDNVNQILSTTRLYLELARNDESERMELIKRSTDNIHLAVSEIRLISKSLVPPSLDDLGLIESIDDLVDSIRITQKLHIEFYYGEEIDERITMQKKLMLFRIIQEQVNNVLRHAEAKNLIIELVRDETNINLMITDDGKGFDLNNIKNKKGVGLSNIASRTELFNGKFTLASEPGKGCKLNIEIPIINQ